METKKIGEIREEFKAAEETMLPSFIEKYRSDERAGVQKLIEQANGRLAKLEAERARIDRLWKYEREYGMYTRICGIDEVGRGPLAGPVVAGAVILPKDCDILYINDSKKLSAAKREELYDVIMEKAVAVGIGMVMMARLGEKAGFTAPGPADKIAAALEKYHLPVHSDLPLSQIVEATASDKKSTGSSINLVLLKDIGESFVHKVARSDLAALAEGCNE